MAQRTGQNKFLGVAIGEKSLVIAEASRSGNAPAGSSPLGAATGRVTQAATFVYPAGVTLDTPEPLGSALGAFLKERGFAARHVVVGVPARWVLSKPKEVPPADPDLIAEALRLQVEGEFSQELQNLVFDYAGEISPTEPRNVLLVAIQDKYLEQIKAMTSAAKLTLSAVTPVGCVLGAAAGTASGKSRSALVVSVGPGGIELIAQDGASPRALRHLGAAGTSAGILAGELRRATFAAGKMDASASANGNGSAVNGKGVNGNGHHGPALVVWDDLTLTDPSRQALADAVGARLESGNLETLGVPAGLTGGPRDAASPSLAGAAALAVAAVTEQDSSASVWPADFLHSRLAAPKKGGINRKTVLIAAGVFVVLLLAVVAYLDLQSSQSRLSDLEAEQVGQKDRVKAAEAFVKRVGYAEKWHQGKPRFLTCLYGLSQAIPEDGKTYVTNITLKENMKGTLTGRTGGSERDVTAIVDRMLKTKLFTGVKAPQIDKRDVGRGGGTEIAFTIEFVCVP
ncbi:hypothetical protein [Humisphaera borealis]|uniref:Uncharacterized protein n=1 Tax=Humisphaera borealis TaxID=2807512 RepID=A0A7M2WX96_9BACT|nr:hypothetical protein [Humisphaera borealis]QOV89822.1 hypothetical protein IPV69_00155 [Humisphaera borealis]